MSKPTLIGDFLHRIKRPIELKSNEKYKLVTVKLKHKGVVLREEKLGSEIKSKMYRVMSGDFILSGIDARNGAFGIVPRELDGAIVTNDFWYFDIDEDVVDKHFFLELTSTKWFDEICRKGSDGTTQRIRLQKNKFFDQTVFLPSLDRQREFVDRFKKFKAGKAPLGEEILFQKELLEKLRLQILQEAIEGKLTEDWRVDNPNSDLGNGLNKYLGCQKTRPEKTTKKKRQKQLPPITTDDIPFSLPKGWQCARIGELFEVVRGSSPRPKGDPRYWTKQETPYHWISIADFNAYGKSGVLRGSKEYLTEEGTRFSREVMIGDLLIACSGSVGKSIMSGINGYIYDGLMAIRNIQEPTVRDFLNLFLKFKEKQTHLLASGATWQNINTEILNNYVVALPPLAEQREIVSKVDRLFCYCDQLDRLIAECQSNKDRLTQAVLREAFATTPDIEGVITKESPENIISSKPDRVDYYKRTLLAAEIVSQLHEEPTLGHLKLQKLIFLCQKTQDMQLPTNFLQQAAGPYDPRMARSIDKQLRDKKWFDYRKGELNKYKPLDEAGSHKGDFEKYFADDLSAISRIIDLFRRARSEEMEAVATLYACWEELLQSGNEVSNELLTTKFYAWSEQKSRFPVEKLEKTISWMTDNGIVPAREAS